LSNQKLRDFKEQFGSENVGLLTGDLSLNRNASVIVMTTEIFRNMLYAEFDEDDDPLADVETVVLDECHYMNDSQRGTVWEESIIHCPSSIQFVALSATVANAGQLTDWIQEVHGPTDLVSSDFRPVPLEFKFCSKKGLHPLLNDQGTGLHPNNKVWRAPKGHKRKGRFSKPPQPESPSLNFVISQMAERDMLPSIYFIFSRRGCDRAVRELGTQCLVTLKQQEIIRSRLGKYIELNPEGVRDSMHVDALLRGIASHHAGVLPAWKELIEELFLKGLVKVVFATETLAAGINMPARSTVISVLSKRTESGHRQLMSSEFLQMSGRAGRRGLDSKGYVITVQSRFDGVLDAGKLATSPPDPLVSQFTPSYGMVLNLLQRYSLEKAKQLVEMSFGRYIASLDFVDEENSLEKLKNQLQRYKDSAQDVPWGEFELYEKLKSRLKEERRLLRILQQQAAETLANELTSALQFSSIGTLVSLKAPQLQGRISPAVIVDKVDSSGSFPLLLCLTDENIWILLSCKSVVSLHAELTCLEVSSISTPTLSRKGELIHGNQQSNEIALLVKEIATRHEMTVPQYDLAGEVITQAGLVSELESNLTQQPAHRWGDRKKLKKHRRRMEALEQEIIEREQMLYFRANRHWETFLELIKILQYFGCLNDLQITEIGRTVAALRGDNELWLGLVLMSGHLDELSPIDLASVLEAVSTEINRPDLWSAYSPTIKAEEAFHDVSTIRRELMRSQEKRKILIPIWWNQDLMGLVAAWAQGESWSELISNTSLDEGDVVRIMRRTVDLLSQVPYCEAISQRLRTNARLALKLINRFPVCEADDLIKAVENEGKRLNPATERLN
tara:strand:- start:4318 stop:6852 length:2535 start_codon:yes stop_codon:yes gene_type:complete